MVFKLIRIDADPPFKSELPTGKHVIGRGKFLHDDAADKRVSRNHAELEITDDSITLKSTHQNPCFYIRKSTTDKEILHQNDCIALSNGDKFGLIPENFWFEVIHCTNTQENETVAENNKNDVTNGDREDRLQDTEKEQNGESTNVDNSNENSTVATKNADSCNENETVVNKDNEIENEAEQRLAEIQEEVQNGALNLDHSEHKEQDVNDSVVNKESETANAGEQNVEDKGDEVFSDSTLCEGSEPRNEENTEEYQVNNDEAGPAPSIPNKRGHESRDSSPVDIKKVKIDPDAVDGQAGTSNNQNEANSDSGDQKPAVGAPAHAPPPAPARERCIYGANCYRRNPQHRAQFSHPADGDWGAGARGVCPYGRACRKLDPRHWQQHQHPPGTSPPHRPDANRRPAQQHVVQRNGNVFHIQAHSVNFYDDHFEVMDEDGDSVDYDYEF